MESPPGWSTLCFITLLCVAAVPWTASQSTEVITACSATFNHSCDGDSCSYYGYYEVQGDDYVFFTVTAQTDPGTWVGIGFSSDQSMVSILI